MSRIDRYTPPTVLPRSPGVTPSGGGGGGDLGIGSIAEAAYRHEARRDRREDIARREAQAEEAEREEREARVQGARITGAIQRDLSRTMDEQLSAYDGSAPGFALAMEARTDEVINSALEAVDPVLAGRLSPRLEDIRQTALTAAQNAERDRRDAFTLQSILDEGQLAANAIRTDPSLFMDHLEQIDDLAAGAGAQRAPQVANDLRRQAARAFGQGLIGQSPREALAVLNSGALDGYLAGGDKDVLIGQAEAAQARIDRENERRANERRAFQALVMGQQFDDHVASILSTGEPLEGFDEAAYYEALPTAQAARALSQANAARAMFQAVGDLSDLTPAQQAQRLAALAPQPGAPGFAQDQQTFEFAQRVIREDARARAADPAGYVMGAETVQAAGAALEASPDDPAARMSFNDAIWAEQARIGIPEHQRAVMPAGQAEALVEAVAAAGPDTRARAMRDVVDALDGYGDYRDVALSQLQAAGLDPMTAVMGQIEDPAARTRLGRAITSGDANLAAVRARHGSTEEKRIRESVETQLRPMIETLLPMNGGVEAANAILNAAEALALDARVRGAGARDAAREAAQAITGAYVFDRGYRIPRAIADAQVPVDHARARTTGADGRIVPDGVDARPVRGDRLIARGTELLTRGLTADDGARLLPLDTVEFGAREAGRRTADMVRRHGQWVTTEDESGLMLMVAPDGVPTPVYFNAGDRAGQPVALSWEQLQALGAERTTRGLGFAAETLDALLAPPDEPDGVPVMRPRGRSGAYGWEGLPVVRLYTGQRPGPDPVMRSLPAGMEDSGNE